MKNLYKILKDVNNILYLLEFFKEAYFMSDNKKINEKITFDEGDDITPYGEFMSSYFAWTSLDDQKKIAEKLNNATKKNKS